MGAKRAIDAAALPKIRYQQALRSWFIYRRKVYSVETCTQDVFVAFVKQVTPSWTAHHRSEQLALHPPPDERLLGRWYSLDGLLRAKVNIVLYGSEQEARQALERAA